MIPNAWNILQPHTAQLEQDHVQPHRGTALSPAHSPACSPHSQRLSAGSSTAPGCALPSPAGNVLLKGFPRLEWWAGCALHGGADGWAGSWALLGFRGFWSTEGIKCGCSWMLALAMGWDVPVPGEVLSHQEQLPGCACLGKPRGFNEQI